jgi:hypothetical protein
VTTEKLQTKRSTDWFGPFANVTSGWLGSRWGFGAAAIFVLVWALTGPIFHYSDTWQLIINSVTNIVTFLMVFLLQCAWIGKGGPATHLTPSKLPNLPSDPGACCFATPRNGLVDRSADGQVLNDSVTSVIPARLLSSFRFLLI